MFSRGFVCAASGVGTDQDMSDQGRPFVFWDETCILSPVGSQTLHDFLVGEVVVHVEDDVIAQFLVLSIWLDFLVRFAHNDHLSQKSWPMPFLTKAVRKSSAIWFLFKSRGMHLRNLSLSSKFFMYSLGVGKDHIPINDLWDDRTSSSSSSSSFSNELPSQPNFSMSLSSSEEDDEDSLVDSMAW